MTDPNGSLAVRRRVATVGVVDQTTTIPTCTITWADTVTTTPGVAYLASYQPAPGDVAVVDLTDGSPMLIGTVGARRVGCRVRRAANQSISNVTATDIQWDTEDYDPYGYITVTSNTVTVPAGLGGTYDLTYRDNGTFGGRSFTQLIVTSSITGVSGNFRSLPDPVTASFGFTSVAGIPLAAGDTFVGNVFQSSGGAVNHTAWLNVVRVGP